MSHKKREKKVPLQIYHSYYTVIKKILSENANNKFSEKLAYVYLARLEIKVLSFNKLKPQLGRGAGRCRAMST